MSDLYSSLHVTPRKKRLLLSDDDAQNVTTPKRLRIMSTSSSSPVKKSRVAVESELPPHLSSLQAIQTSLHYALSHSLATSALSPSEDTGILPNVLNNYTLATSAGLSRSCSLDDLKRLCWLWEWDAKSLPRKKDDDDNPFLDDSNSMSDGTKWSRGAMGLIITPTTHLLKLANKRVPAYGIGIEVEMDIDKNMTGGMAAVARWTAGNEQRIKEVRRKLQRWVQLHKGSNSIPLPPMADLPPLIAATTKQSAVTQRLASLSPKSSKTIASPCLTEPPASPSRSSPSKLLLSPVKHSAREFVLPITPTSLPRRNATKFPAIPRTPNTTGTSSIAFPTGLKTPQHRSAENSVEFPSTPVHQKGSNAPTAPDTPSTSRRAALYERIRKRSESQVLKSPSKPKITSASGMTRDQLMKLGQEEMRRRCLLGRLGGVAESIWMLFATPTNTSSTGPSVRKRRTLPSSEVVEAIIKSSPVPISVAEAEESITLLSQMCPFFIRKIDVGGEDWVEMPASAALTNTNADSVTSGLKANSDQDDLKSLSPKRVKKEERGLRQVRECIRKELEAD